MWSLIIRVPGKEPDEHILVPGQTIIGRKSDCDIVLSDPSASRLHAELIFDVEEDSITITDLGSTNGTFVNREKIVRPKALSHDDVIRIGGTMMDVIHETPGEKMVEFSGTQVYTRELVLEALDHHAVLLYEVARQLNTVLDIDTALSKVSNLMRKAMGANRCQVILAKDFKHLHALNFPQSIAETAITKKSAIVIPNLDASVYKNVSASSVLMRICSILCVPVVSGDDVIALIYMYKTDRVSRPFTPKDVQLAVAISHQASLTIQRMELLEQVRKEQRGRMLLERFVSPKEAEFMLNNYLKTGQLPEVSEREVSVVFLDIANSTSLAERVRAKKFGDIIERFYQCVTDEIFDYGGLVRYVGDGVMGVFGMIPNRGDHAARAVRAGIALRDCLLVEEFGEEIIFGIGINTGSAIVGYIGNQQRVELTAVGDMVNVAYHLQGMARPNRILLGEATAQEIGNSLPLRDLGIRNVRGRTQPLHVFEITLAMEE